MGDRSRHSTRGNPGVTDGTSNESKAVSTHGVRTTDEEDGKELDAEGRARYRPWTMRASYQSVKTGVSCSSR